MKSDPIIGKIPTGFQAAVFKNDMKIMISIRGSDSYLKFEHIFTDWLNTNFLVGIAELPEAITCGIWLYNKVIKDFPKHEIYVTGHSMGAIIAQYIALYDDSNLVIKTVTWNGLGVIKPKETIVWGKIENEYLKKIANNFEKMKNSEIIVNYNYYKDVVGSLRFNVGKHFSVDTCTSINTAILDNHKDLINEIMNLLISEQIWKSRKKEKLSLSDKITWIFLDNSFKSRLIKFVIAINKKKLIDKLVADVKGKGYSLGGYHQLNNFMPFFDTDGKINRDGNLSYNFLMNSFKFVLQTEKSLIPIISKEEKPRKPGKIYDYVISEKNNKNLLWNRINKSYKKDDTNWYTPKVPEVGKFNNIDYIAGVPGGDPLKLTLIDTKTKIQGLCKVSNGNFTISKNV